MPTGRPSDYSDETVSIYALRDPDSGRIRYIGKAKNPSQRFKGHLADSARKRAPSADWIRSLQAQGKKPVLDVITECPASRWQEFEKEAISILKEEGVKLLNLADGGDQPYCPPSVRSANGKRCASLRPPHITRHYRRLESTLRALRRLGPEREAIAKCEKALEMFRVLNARVRALGTIAWLEAEIERRYGHLN